ncbi:putative cation exchanger C521.04c [Anneissia japonica]|uniref:putative cation exchanger C521.04c n=1 Tax=Anneissia japonica TaxID=1529436 RepID=UPI00142578AD|nr:putative cation exchanger C521.04c [Anneissia japonica]
MGTVVESDGVFSMDLSCDQTPEPVGRSTTPIIPRPTTTTTTDQDFPVHRPTPATTGAGDHCLIDHDNGPCEIQSNQGPRLRFGSRERSNTNDRISEDGFVMVEAENAIEAQKMEQNSMFGFKKWKSHLTARPLEQRSEVVRKLYEEPKTIQPFVSTLGVGNVLYVILFGWWISLIYVLVGLLMFVTIIGSDYGFFCLRLAWYLLWPFGKFVQKKSEEEVLGSNSSKEEVDTPILEDETIPIAITRGISKSSDSTCYLKLSFIIWAVLGFPILVLVHLVTIIITGFLVVFIPISKMNVIMIKQVLLLPPKKLGIKPTRTWNRSNAKPREMIMCSYQAVNVYYYKYTIDGINIFIVNMLPIVLAALILGYLNIDGLYVSQPTIFVLALISFIPMSYYIGMGITSISAQSSHAVGAVINATFGSVVEITLYISSLFKNNNEEGICYDDLVKSALTGTLLATMLLIPGISMVIGGIKHREQRFNMHSAGVSSSLLFISVAGAFTPTIFAKAFGAIECSDCSNNTNTSSGGFSCLECHYTVAGTKEDTKLTEQLNQLVYTCTALLPLAYLIGLIYTLKTHTFIFDTQHGDGKGHKPIVLWGRIKSGIILLVAVTVTSLCAELVAKNIQPLLTSWGMSEMFTGVTILALAPSIPEILNGIQFARQNNINMSIEIGSSVAVQVCLLQIPILVLVNVIFDNMHFLLVFNDIHLWSVILSVVIMNYIFIDGKSDYFQGSVLVIVYAILIAMFFFAPKTACI